MKPLSGTFLLRALPALVASCAALGLCGCSTVAARNTVAVVGGTVVGAHTPTSSISQVYYLGVFDPQDQLPPTIYRVRVNGQASALNSANFASGWVRAELVDSLSGKVELPSDKAGGGNRPVEVEREQRLLTGRRLVMFGPEGFREAPKDHRLVVVMGSSPEAFFSAVDQALGVVASVTQEPNAGPAIEKALWADLSRVRGQAQRIDILNDGIKNDPFPGS